MGSITKAEKLKRAWVSKQHHLTYWNLRIAACFLDCDEFSDAAEAAELYKKTYCREQT